MLFQLISRLQILYNGSLDSLDVYVGGMLESNGVIGECFQHIIIDQFKRIRDADRFWFENRINK